MRSFLLYFQWNTRIKNHWLSWSSVHPSFNMGYLATLLKVGAGIAEFVRQPQIYFSKMHGFIWAPWTPKTYILKL